MILPIHGEAAETDLTVYAWILNSRQLDLGLMQQDLGLTISDLEGSIDRLCAVGLVVRPDDDPATGFAVDPAVAIAKLTSPIEARLREEERRILTIRDALDRFTPHYLEKSSSSHGLEILGNVNEVRAALNREAARCSHEMISCQPGGVRASRRPCPRRCSAIPPSWSGAYPFVRSTTTLPGSTGPARPM